MRLPLLLGALVGCGGDRIPLTPDTAEIGEDTVEVIEDTYVDTDETDETDEDTDVEDTAQDALDEANYEAFYDPMVVQEVRLELSSDAIRDLDYDPFTYVEGNVVVNGERIESVGVRLKGSSSFQDFSGKPAFKVKFNWMVPGRKFATLERVTLNNMVGDPTQSREMIGYAFWRDQGLWVPRCNYTRVYVNDELFGLYLNLEAMDDHLLERHFNAPEGDLWEGNDSADFTRRGVRHLELVTGVVGDATALDAVSDLIRASGDQTFYEEVDTVIDMDEFLDFWAFSIAIGNRDGYPYNLNDFFVYGDPQDGRFDFAPWGMDETWDTGMTWNYVNGTVASHCISDQDCLEALYAHTDAALAAYEAADLPAWALQVWDVSEVPVGEDPRRPYTVTDVAAYRSLLLTQIQRWPSRVRGQMGL